MEDRTVTIMRILPMNGAVLTYDTDDVDDITISTPNDIHEIGVTEKGYALRELGQAHLDLHIDFKPGKKPLWIDAVEVLLPDVHAQSGALTAALEAEGVPEELASRIHHRFFFGDPDDFDRQLGASIREGILGEPVDLAPFPEPKMAADDD